MLQRVLFEINALKIHSHCFLMHNAYHIRVDLSIFNILLQSCIYHISPPISDDHFVKVRITTFTPVFTIFSFSFRCRLALITFLPLWERKESLVSRVRNHHFHKRRHLDLELQCLLQIWIQLAQRPHFFYNEIMIVERAENVNFLDSFSFIYFDTRAQLTPK